MTNQTTSFWKIGFFIVITVFFLLSIAYLEKNENRGEKALFLNTEPTLISLDERTFHDPILFERATLLTTHSLNFHTPLRHFLTPIRSMAVRYDPEFIYLTQGHNLIRLAPQRKDEVFDLQKFSVLDSPLVAISLHPLDQDHLLAISEQRSLYEIAFTSQALTLKKITTLTFLPTNMKLEAFWENSLKRTMTVALSTPQDTLLMELNPKHWNEPSLELIFSRERIKSGFQLSKELMVLITDKPSLKILDWEKRALVGSYEPNKNFTHPKLLHQSAIAMGLGRNHIYYVATPFELIELTWTKTDNVIILNRNFQAKNGKINIEWKMPTQHPNVVYLAETSLKSEHRGPTTSSRALREHSIVQKTFGPIKQNLIEVPYTHSVKELIIKVLAIDNQNGKLIAPSETFTLEAEEKQ